MFIISILYLRLFVFVSLFNSYVIWWSVFLVIRFLFFYLIKEVRGYSSIVNYFFIQEVLGVLFLLLYFIGLQFLVLIIKIGVSPFHFWVITVAIFLSSFNFIWFLTFQKLPFIPILITFLSFMLVFLFIGFIVCYYQMFLIKIFKLLLIVSSVERFNWILMNFYFSLSRFIIIFVYYFSFMVLLLKMFRFNEKRIISWELILIFINFPLGLRFFVKLLSIIISRVYYSIIVLVLLIIIFLRMLSLRFIMFSFGIKSYKRSHLDFSFSDFFWFPLIYRFLLLFYTSKSYYIVLIRQS